MIEVGLAEGLTLGVVAEVGLEAKGFDGGDERLDGVHRGARFRGVAHDVAATFAEHGVDGAHAIGGRLDLDLVDWFHQSGSGHEEGAVGATTGGGDDLTAAALQRRVGD